MEKRFAWHGDGNYRIMNDDRSDQNYKIEINDEKRHNDNTNLSARHLSPLTRLLEAP
jgi:hypothetical protein